MEKEIARELGLSLFQVNRSIRFVREFYGVHTVNGALACFIREQFIEHIHNFSWPARGPRNGSTSGNND